MLLEQRIPTLAYWIGVMAISAYIGLVGLGTASRVFNLHTDAHMASCSNIALDVRCVLFSLSHSGLL